VLELYVITNTPELAWRDWAKPYKISDMTVHVLAEIRTRYLPNTSQIYYHYSHLAWQTYSKI
jgi:hypothetical protein